MSSDLCAYITKTEICINIFFFFIISVNVSVKVNSVVQNFMTAHRQIKSYHKSPEYPEALNILYTCTMTQKTSRNSCTLLSQLGALKKLTPYHYHSVSLCKASLVNSTTRILIVFIESESCRMEGPLKAIQSSFFLKTGQSRSGCLVHYPSEF